MKLLVLLLLLPTMVFAEVSPERLQYELEQGRNIDKAFLLADVAWCEASIEGRVGMLAVMDVILNRVKHPKFPNTVHEVVNQRWAFECITRKVPIDRNSSTYNTAFKLALAKVHGDAPRITRATHYYNPSKVTPSWSKSSQMSYLGDIGRHRFYIGF